MHTFGVLIVEDGSLRKGGGMSITRGSLKNRVAFVCFSRFATGNDLSNAFSSNLICIDRAGRGNAVMCY